MDFSNIARDFRKEIVRSGEAYLDGQLKIAAAADARASSIAGMFIAAATALTVGAVIALANPAWAGASSKIPLVIGGAVAAVMFFVGAFLCISAIQPVDFNVPGVDPESWEDDVKSGKKLSDCLGERAGHIQTQIIENEQTIASNAGMFRCGARLGITAAPVGLVVWGLCQYLIFSS